MALTLQRKLELAGDLAKVQPALQRLHIVAPKKRFGGFKVVIVVSVVGAVALAVAAVAVRKRLHRVDDVDAHLDTVVDAAANGYDRAHGEAGSLGEEAVPTTE